MARLPKPGADAGSWGDILNNYLSESHESDGTLKANTVGAKQIQANALGKSDVGLANVDNTADAYKPISNATQTALNQKVSTSALDNLVASNIDDDASATAQTLARTFVHFTDLDGNPLPDPARVVIKVDTDTGRIEDIVVEGIS